MLNYPLGDVYPLGLPSENTANRTTVSGEAAESLQEEKSTVDKNRMGSDGKSILLAMGVIACMAIFFGIE